MITFLASLSTLWKKRTWIWSVLNALIIWRGIFQKNHLAGLKSKFLKVQFPSTVEMTTFKRDLMKQVKKNRENFKNTTDYTSILAKNMGCNTRTQFDEPKEQIIDIRLVSLLEY